MLVGRVLGADRRQVVQRQAVPPAPHSLDLALGVLAGLQLSAPLSLVTIDSLINGVPRLGNAGCERVQGRAFLAVVGVGSRAGPAGREKLTPPNALPADAAVMAAAVADWRVANQGSQKMKKDGSGRAPALEFAENPDILATVSKGAARPRLVVGFAAETEHVVDHATAKRARKGCDWIVANDVSPATGIMGGTENAVVLISDTGAEVWPRMAKDAVARRLAERIAAALQAR